MEYEEFLKSKQFAPISSGFIAENISDKLFPFQADIVKWSCKKGKAAIFANTGLGKTAMQLIWSDQVHKHTGKDIIIFAPLAVAQQTVSEGRKFGVDVNLCRTQTDVLPGINITNYEMISHFDPGAFVGVVLDESSCIKSFDSKFRKYIIDAFRETPYRLACTATPAPNDHMELGNHAEFLGVMKRNEMLAKFFVHDGGETQKWRLKGHAIKIFWEWVASWAVMLHMPSDLGYDDNGFVLPPLNINQVVVDKSGYVVKEAKTLQDRRQARRNSLDFRVKEASRVALESPKPVILWCDLNVEADALKKALPIATEIRGSDSPEKKTQAANDFSNNKIDILISKSSIFGFGMNWQNCNNVIFVGISDSFESYYQAVRRCWRFGQKKHVNVTIITSEAEGAVVKNIKRKEKEFEKMLAGMISNTQEITKENLKSTEREVDAFVPKVERGDGWELRLGDSCIELKTIADNAIHYILFSPPFSSLYTYSNSPRDLGNCQTDQEFYDHFQFIAEELYRVLMPGRIVSVHCMNLPTSKEMHGVIGVRDFRGDLIRIFQKVGFIYHSEVCIWKDPVTAMQRTKAIGLLHKQLKKDSCISRQGIPDYVVSFRKPGENPERVTHTNESFPVSVWQRYASPIWMDINPSDTLQKTSAREDEDERHIAPLQLEVIRRCLELWTNEGDLVLSPFAGIGSEGFEAVKNRRRFIGIELKESYYNQAVGNMKKAAFESKKPPQVDLFKFEDNQEA